MPEIKADTTAAHQVELAIGRLDSLSTLPCVAARTLSRLLQTQDSPTALAETIESDPALSAKIFSLIAQQDVSIADENLSVHQALGKLAAHTVREAVLSVKVSEVLDSDINRILPRKELVQHSLAVACCAKEVAKIVSPEMNPHLVYSAGLLHDIGKLAVEEVMPKSFARIVEEAKSQRACVCGIEQKHLGVDHTILGKHLAQKWQLPEQITLAIWLHHSEVSLITANVPEARIAQIVRLADSVARQCGIGQSGSYDSPNSTEQMIVSLAITVEQLEQIRRNLAKTVEQKSKTLGLDLPNAWALYCESVQTTAAQLSREHTKLSLDNRQLQISSGHFDFIADFLSSINSASSPIDVAKEFAVGWQKFYQTGMVCLYLTNRWNRQLLEAVLVESLSQSKTIYINAPADSPPIPRALTKGFAILNAQYYIDWLFEQLEVDFELSQTKMVPLLSNGKVIGAIVFELRYPGDSELFKEQFKTVTCIAGAVLDMAIGSAERQRFAEQFVQLVGKGGGGELRASSTNSLAALAEMAGGAAHELNNPLSVISGRAQLLGQTETDPEKKRMLRQIQENSNELSGIIRELMNFAKPPQPRPTRTDIKQMLDEATQLAAQKTNIEQLDVQTDVTDNVKEVFIDSGQVVSAIANVFCNALESYDDGVGPIKVTGVSEKSGDFVKLQISDSGCGMDAETVQKATQPFFSSQPAGRKRGMGLAQAQRLIQLNKGTLRVTSQPGSGTTVTISLPCK